MRCVGQAKPGVWTAVHGLRTAPQSRPEARKQALRGGHRVRSPSVSLGGHAFDARSADPGTGSRRRPIRRRISRNSLRGTTTSAIWRITCRACVTTFAPILISFCRSPDVRRDQRPMPRQPFGRCRGFLAATGMSPSHPGNTRSRPRIPRDHKQERAVPDIKAFVAELSPDQRQALLGMLREARVGETDHTLCTSSREPLQPSQPHKRTSSSRRPTRNRHAVPNGSRRNRRGVQSERDRSLTQNPVKRFHLNCEPRHCAML
jgi:hypothetical protein